MFNNEESATTGQATVTLPIAFSNYNYCLLTQMRSSDPSSRMVSSLSGTVSSFVIAYKNPVSAGRSYWLAIGK